MRRIQHLLGPGLQLKQRWLGDSLVLRGRGIPVPNGKFCLVAVELSLA
ncbi:hypothetical protein WI665_14395 [Vibrio cholerae]